MAFSVNTNVYESNVNVNNNTSDVTLVVTLNSTYGSSFNDNKTGKLVIDGTSYNITYNFPSGTTSKELGRATKTVTHNNDGSKSVNWSYSLPTNSTQGTKTGSGSIGLTTIARASQPSCITWPQTTQDIGNVGDTITIHMNRKSTSFKHTVTYTLGSKSDTIATNVEDNCRWQIPLDLANYITNSKSGNGTIYVETFNGTTSIGKKSVSFTVNVPNTATFTPTIDFGTNNNKITPIRQFDGKYLNKVSGATISSNRNAKYGASVSSYTITAGSKSSANSDLTVNPINISMSSASQEVTINGTITDSRGYQGSGTTSIVLYRYNLPQITDLTIQRCLQDGTIDINGTYALVNLTYTYQNDGYSNSMQVHQIQFDYEEPETLTTEESSADGVVTGTGTTIVGGSLSINNHYNYVVTCTDAVGNTATINGTLPTSSRVINVRPGGLGISFGKFAEQDNLVDSEWDIKAPQFNGPLNGTATNSTNVNVLSTTLASGTNYYPLFSTGTGNQRARANTNIKLPVLSGTLVVKQSATIATETNGWYKVDMGGYTQYFLNGTRASTSYNGNSWGSFNINLPSGITFNSTKMIFSGNGRGSDNAVSMSFVVANNGTVVVCAWKNQYSSAVTTAISYNFSLIVFP